MPLHKIKAALARVKSRLRRTSDAKARRKRAMSDALWRRWPLVRLTLLAIGYLWILAIPLPQLGQKTYIDENALQPGQVRTNWEWTEVHRADRYLDELERLRDRNASHDERAAFISNEFEKLGIPARLQRYAFSTSLGSANGTNAYAVLHSPRASGTEAMVISASWVSRTGEGDGTLNLRGIATVLAFASFVKTYSLWAKDLVFVVSDGYLDGMQAWITTYHGVSNPNMVADPLTLSSGVIWNALNIDYPGHSFSHLGIFHDGLNGRLPNQDLINSVSLISRRTAGVPIFVYDHLDKEALASRGAHSENVPAWVPDFLRKNEDVREYAARAKNILRHVNYQARGRASGVHGLMHPFRIDAITLFAVPAQGPHGFHSLGRVMESSLRTMNNLLERLHASFFFYLLVGQATFLSMGFYLPSAIVISVGLLFGGLGEWVSAAWTLTGVPADFEKSEKSGNEAPMWTRQDRPVLPAVAIMAFTHLLGLGLSLIINWTFFIAHQEVVGGVVVLLLSATTMLLLTLVPPTSPGTASISSLLKALNMCFASTVISVTAVLNFSLAATLAVILGVPLTLSSSSQSPSRRTAKYVLYTSLALGWLFVCPGETRQAVWNWEVLGVWFAPFVSIVYVPLVLQAALVCVLPP